MDASHVCLGAWALGCFHSHISTQTFRRALTALVDSCAEILKECPFSGITKSGRFGGRCRKAMLGVWGKSLLTPDLGRRASLTACGKLQALKKQTKNKPSTSFESRRNSFFLLRADVPHIYVRASTLCCFRHTNSKQWFTAFFGRKVPESDACSVASTVLLVLNLTESVDRYAKIKSAPSVA